MEYTNVLNRWFAIISPDEFTKSRDPFLLAFYKWYEKEKENRNTTLFIFFIQYLLRKKEYKDFKTEVEQVCKETVGQYFVKHIVKKNEDGKDEIIEIIEIPPTQHLLTMTLSKPKLFNMLSAAIKLSDIVEYEEPTEDYTKYDEEFRNETTKNIIDELIASGTTLPTPVKDKQFNTRSKYMDIHYNTQLKCDKFCTNTQMYKLLSATYLITTENSLLHNSVIHYIDLEKYDEDKEYIDEPIPIALIRPRPTNNRYNTVITKAKFLEPNGKVLHICSTNRMACGGGATQGIYTNESELAYRTTYLVNTNKIELFFPLQSTDLLFLPNVLLFKDTSYNMLKPDRCKKIAVLAAYNVYRPECNIEINNDNYTTKLNDSTTVMKNEKIYYDRLRNIFNTALYLGYDCIAVDDQGVSEFWIPTIQSNRIFHEVLNQFNGRFSHVYICSIV